MSLLSEFDLKEFREIILPAEEEIIRVWGSKESTHPVVSVVCISYNHENYIEDSIKGFLLQRTNFPFEILIHDDASTDRTAEIIKKYKSLYPNLIKCVLQSENKYRVDRQYPFRCMFSMARGQFIAICEGDDFYICPNKLQKNVDQMNGDSSLSMLFGPAKKIYDNSSKVEVLNAYQKDEISRINTEWVLKKGGGFYPTCTLMIRSSIIRNLPKWFSMHYTGDYPLGILASQKGKIGYCSEIMSCYRVHPTSVTHTIERDKEKVKKSVLETYKMNICFIDTINEEGVTTPQMNRFLLAKEDYLYYSKILDNGLKIMALAGVCKIRFSLYFKFRLICKFVYRLFR